jgi:murein peptide amidase A
MGWIRTTALTIAVATLAALPGSAAAGDASLAGYQVPLLAYDGSGGGISGDGGTLVLGAISNGTYLARPRRLSRFAVLDTAAHLSHPRAPDPRAPRHAVTHFSLRGEVALDAISPDGEVAYFARYGAGRRAGDGFRLIAVDTASGRVLKGPLEAEGEAPMAGAPATRTQSRDGRWVYTLYVGARDGKVFVQLLDTVGNRVSRVDLPQLKGLRDPFSLSLSRGPAGRLVVGEAPSRGGRQPKPSTPLLALDPASGAVRPEPGLADVARMPRAVPIRHRGSLGFLFTPRGRGNLMGRAGIAGHSADGRPIRVNQWGDPARAAVLVFGCIHGDECAARNLEPRFVLSGGCPDPAADLVLVHNLDPDGLAAGSRLNGDGVDLNRNFAVDWRPIGSRGGAQYSGPKPFSEPESRLAARIVRAVDPRVTIWFHQDSEPGAYVRAWGQSPPAGRRFAQLAGFPFRLLPWLDGTAPNWQNQRFPGTSSFVVELPPGPLRPPLERHLEEALARIAHRVGED